MTPRRATSSPLGSSGSLHKRLSGKYNRGVDWVILGTSSFATAKAGYNWVRDRFTYTVAVTSDDRIYPAVHEWLLATFTDQEVKAMVARSDWGGDGPRSFYDEERHPPKICLYSDDRSKHRVVVGGQRVTVVLDKPELRDAKDAQMMKKMERIVFTANSAGGREAVVRLLEDLLAKMSTEHKVPKFNVLGSWGEWVQRSDSPRRSYDSVILRSGLAEEIKADLQQFLDSKENYVKRSIPYHRCYLLYGPPGSGKTSIATALSTEFGLDCWYMGLGDVQKDTGLLNLVSQVQADSLLLMEDIDVFHAAASREDAPRGDSLADLLPGVSLSGLLNSLDGMATPSGLVTIITTNHREKLDPALLRTGRVDRQFFIDYADNEQANRLFEFFYDKPPQKPVVIPPNTSCSDLMEIFKQNMEDPDVAEAEVRALSGRALSGRALSGRALSGRALPGKALPGKAPKARALHTPATFCPAPQPWWE
jgi:hypothetical protein